MQRRARAVHVDAFPHRGAPAQASQRAVRRAAALVWYNLDRDGRPDRLTLHAGEPVERGEKWGMNIWLRERAPPEKGGVEAQQHAPPPPPPPPAPQLERCTAGCESETTPLGLCLCGAQYEPSTQS